MRTPFSAAVLFAALAVTNTAAVAEFVLVRYGAPAARPS